MFLFSERKVTVIFPCAESGNDPQNQYLLLTDIARQKDEASPSTVIQGWLRNRNTLEFLRIWEIKNNPGFDKSQCEELLAAVRKPSFTITIRQWINRTKAIGLISKQGKNGGTFAHPDIALDFAMYIDPEIRAGFIMGNSNEAVRAAALSGCLTYEMIQAASQEKQSEKVIKEIQRQAKEREKPPKEQLADDATFYWSVCILRKLRDQGLLTQDEYERIKEISRNHYGSNLYIG